MKYIIITPAKNEEKYIGYTLESVCNQTVKPKKWVIVNDNSRDRTEDIIKKYSAKYKWIKLIQKNNSKNIFGTNVVENFYIGYNSIKEDNFDFIVKLDADLKIDKDNFFEYLLNKFCENPRLGICSGITYYNIGRRKKVVMHPPWHTTGAMKIYRRKCFEDIGGLVPILLWDGVDEYKAMFRGWTTKTFFECKVNHLAQIRSFKRQRNVNFFLKIGKSSYIVGFPFEYAVSKFLFYIFFERKDIKAFYYLFGYFKAFIEREKRIVNKNEIKFIRSFQYRRIIFILRKFSNLKGKRK